LYASSKQKREIISYAKENPKLTQQQIADNLTIKWDLPIKRRYSESKGIL
jgi:ABC-type iron transport system FetAB ATPase subunit